MALVQIDIIGPQPPQGSVTGGNDVGSLQAGEFRQHSNLGGDDDALAAAARRQPIADHCFAFSPLMARHPGGVDIGRVDKAEAGGDKSVKQCERRFFIRRPAKDIPAQAQRRHVDARKAKLAFFNGHREALR